MRVCLSSSRCRMYQSHPRTAPNADAGDGCLFLSRPASLPAALVLPSCSYMSTFQRTLSLGHGKDLPSRKRVQKYNRFAIQAKYFSDFFRSFFTKKHKHAGKQHRTRKRPRRRLKQHLAKQRHTRRKKKGKERNGQRKHLRNAAPSINFAS